MSDNKFFLNKIPIENISVGMKASYENEVTDSDVRSFASLSGDHNPIHLDENFAKKSRYGDRIAHGLMTASYFSGLFGTEIPGEGCVYVSQSLKFKRAVYIGDIVIASVEVIGVNKKQKKVLFKTTCKVKGKIVTVGEAEIFIP